MVSYIFCMKTISVWKFVVEIFILCMFIYVLFLSFETQSLQSPYKVCQMQFEIVTVLTWIEKVGYDEQILQSCCALKHDHNPWPPDTHWTKLRASTIIRHINMLQAHQNNIEGNMIQIIS